MLHQMADSQPPASFAAKAAILGASSLTVLAGAIVAPALPSIALHFQDHPQSELLVRLIVTLPALAIALTASPMGWAADRLGKKRLLFLALGVYLMAGLSGVWLESLELILAGRFLLGMAVAGILTASIFLGQFLSPLAVAPLVRQKPSTAFLWVGAILCIGALGLISARVPKAQD